MRGVSMLDRAHRSREERHMGQVVYANAHDAEWLRPEGDWEAASGKPDSRYKLLEAGGPAPTVLIAEFEPGHYQEAHSHPTSEVLYILRGDVTIGDVTSRAGTMVFVEKDTRYGPLTAGPKCVKFLRVEIP
jgi:quercetin dioxygenase-like cupin family protein